MPMAFTLHLSQDVVEVEAGGTTPVNIIVVNRGPGVDRFELELEGIDAEWTAVPVPTFSAEQDESHPERIFIKPPRASESLAGNYPFVVRVRSLDSGEEKMAQGVIRLKPYHHLSMEIDPKKGFISPLIKRNRFEVTIANLGNTEHTLHLLGSDPEDACAYEFEHEQITLGPGQQKDVVVAVRPARNHFLASGKLMGFSITGRSTEVPSLLASSQAQLEQRGIVSPMALFVVVLLGALFGLFLYSMPKPPSVSITVSPLKAVVGQQVVVTWAAKDANHVRITTVGPSGVSTPIYDGSNTSQSLTYSFDSPGTEQIVADVSKDTRHGKPDSASIDVSAPPALVKPTINSFTVTGAPVKTTKGEQYVSVKLHSSLTFKWDVSDAVNVGLAPVAQNIAPELGSYQVTLDQVGPQDFHLVAFSKDKLTASSKMIHVNVYEESDATILSFSAAPATVDTSGTTTISWQVTNAALVKLTGPDGQESTVLMTGSQPFTINSNSSFVLTALDAKGRKAVKKIVVTVNRPAPPPDSNLFNSEGSQAGGTTGITPATTTATTSTTGSTATDGG